MTPHDLHAHRHLAAGDEITERRCNVDDDLPEPETVPDTTEDAELLQAIEWLKKAGVVTGERPAFSSFFDELVASGGEGENTDTSSRSMVVPANNKKSG